MKVYICVDNRLCYYRMHGLTHIQLCSESLLISADDVQVRLSHGYYGLVQVYYNNQWGTVCDDRFNNNHNGCDVVCRQISYTYQLSPSNYR